jgi:hypothetical protein
VEAIDQRIVAAGVEVQRAHDGGYAQQLGPHRETGHGGGEPQEGAQAGERRAQQPDYVPPVYPQRHRSARCCFDERCRYLGNRRNNVESPVIDDASILSLATGMTSDAILI